MVIDDHRSWRYLQLGASLYVPATHPDLLAIVRGSRYPQLKSLIIDLEDALAENEWEIGHQSIRRLLLALLQYESRPRFPLLFVRVRHVACFQRLLNLKGVEQLNGFVWPKFTQHNMQAYMRHCPAGFDVMPILERDLADVRVLLRMRDFLLKHSAKILSLRLGITDLLSVFNLRRDCYQNLYEISLVKHLIGQVMVVFKPAGFNISAPVYECIGDNYVALLQEEVRQDLANGFFGKTVIHPWQIEVVQAQYQVTATDFEIATQLLNPHSPAVFKRYGQMHEKATHSQWAQYILGRADIYGIMANNKTKVINQ